MHLSCDVRIAGLSLLVSSSSSSQPFSIPVLKVLQRHLPYFQVETDAGARNDFASTVKRLCIRLQGAIFRLQKSFNTQDSLTFKHHFERTAMTSGILERKTLLDAHLEFVRWYIGFISYELHTLASYQRHFSGLKAFVRLHSSGLLQLPEVCHLLFLSLVNWRLMSTD